MSTPAVQPEPKKQPWEYSTNPNTVRARKRKAKLTEEQRVAEHARDADQKSILRAVKIRSDTMSFQQMSPDERVRVIEEIEKEIMERRRRKGRDYASKMRKLHERLRNEPGQQAQQEEQREEIEQDEQIEQGEPLAVASPSPEVPVSSSSPPQIPIAAPSPVIPAASPVVAAPSTYPPAAAPVGGFASPHPLVGVVTSTHAPVTSMGPSHPPAFPATVDHQPVRGHMTPGLMDSVTYPAVQGQADVRSRSAQSCAIGHGAQTSIVPYGAYPIQQQYHPQEQDTHMISQLQRDVHILSMDNARLSTELQDIRNQVVGIFRMKEQFETLVSMIPTHGSPGSPGSPGIHSTPRVPGISGSHPIMNRGYVVDGSPAVSGLNGCNTVDQNQAKSEMVDSGTARDMVVDH